MELRLGATVYYFLWSFVLGAVLAFLYDFLRSSRRIVRTSVIGINLEDFLFFLIASFLFFWNAYDKNNGRIRLHGFAGVVLGFWLYRKLFQDFIVRIMVLLVELAVKLLVFLLRIILFPLSIIYRILSKPFLVVGWYSRRGFNKAERVLKVMKRRKKMMKNKTDKKVVKSAKKEICKYKNFR